MGRSIHVLLLILLAGCTAEGEPPADGSEASVRPGVNERYLADDLDVDLWTERFEGEAREIYRSRGEIVGSLELAPGMEVADVGAGTGLFVGSFAEAVGADGRVYAIDIAPRFVAHLRDRVAKSGLTQVEVVAGAAREVPLPPDSIDAAFVCDVYHHFEYPRSMLESLRSALRPGGTLFVIDFERIPGESRDWVIDHVRAGKAEFSAEIEAAGFELAEEVEIDGLEENYALRFRSP